MTMKGWNKMKKMLALIPMLGCAAMAKPDVTITCLLDGTLTGGAPKVIELYVSGTENLAEYEIWRSLNGAAFGSGTGAISSLTGIYSNTFVYLVKNDHTGVFFDIWGDEGIYANTIPLGIISGNGNDGFQIRRKVGSVVIDQVWTEDATDSYRDSYWHRKHGTGPDGGWIVSNWATPGNDALDGLDEAGLKAAVPFGVFAIAWNGLTADWNDPSNWSSGVVPSGQTNVVIADTAALFPEIGNLPDDPAVCLNLTLLDTARLTIQAGKALTVHGNLDLQGASSRSAGNGMTLQAQPLPVPTGSLKILGQSTGAMDVEKYLPKDNRWRLLSSPVQGQLLRPGFVPADPDQTFDFYSWDETAPMELGWVNIRDENGSWNPGFDTSFMTGKGYLTAYSPACGGDEIKTFSANIHSGMQDIPLSYTLNHWNLLGNPYTCALDWSSAGIGKEGVAGNAMYIWDPALNNDLGGYRTHNGSVGVPAGSLPVIPAMQGFFVLSLAEGNLNIDIHADDPLIHHAQTYNNEDKAPDQGQLRLMAKKGNVQDEVLILLHPEATNGYDPQLDVVKLFSGHEEVPEIYILTENGKKLCIDMIRDLPASVPIGIRLPVSDSVIICAHDFEQLEPWIGIYLEDKVLANFINLREEECRYFHQPFQAAERFVIHLMNTAFQEEYQPTASNLCYAHNGRICLANPETSAVILSVYSLDGRMIRSWRVPPGQQVIHTGLNPGLYLVRMAGNKGNQASVIMIH